MSLAGLLTLWYNFHMTNDIGAISFLLESLFKKLPIEIVYLYGSVAHGKNDRFSDYDFGFLFSRKLNKDKRFNLRLRLYDEVARRLKTETDNIDVVDLSEVPSLLQFNAISGKFIYCRSGKIKLLFETYVMARYHDEHYYYEKYLFDTLDKIEKGVYFDRRISYS